MQKFEDTIFALSSGGLPSGVAVIRISGKRAFDACRELVGTVPEARTAALKSIRSRNDLFFDQGLVLTFPGPNSFTGEDCVEFQVHGGRAVVHAILSELSMMDGMRPAEVGEFSRRAFENGKMDLVEVEGLADLIAAETEMQRRLAVEQSFGGLSTIFNAWATRLTRARALIEAELDFADEEDVPDSVSAIVWADMRELGRELDQHIAGARYGEIIRDGFKVVLVGPPNAGKSSLMNALAKRDVAIVTDIAGTTRDLLHVDLNVEGYVIKLYDTAGLREADNVVEAEGIRRARVAMESADLVLKLEEIDSPPEQTIDIPSTAPVFNIGTKLDIHPTSDTAYDLRLSTRTGEGVEDLRKIILEKLTETAAGTLILPSRVRQIEYLSSVRNYVQEAVNSENADLALRAEYLRLAATQLGRITGQVDVESLLDVIFSEFCIGK